MGDQAPDDEVSESAGSFIRELVREIQASAPTPDEDLVGQTMGRYKVVALLGKGGMGHVYEAEDGELGRRVAIKFLPAASAARAERVGRFLRERSVTAELEHPGIVPVYDSGVWTNGRPFYVMRKVSGAPLDRLMRGAESLEARLALLGNVLAVTDAVAFAHHHGVIHRDLKPSNVLVASFGETLVADWGLAKRVRDVEAKEEEGAPEASSGATRQGAVLGTPAYMAPEQARGERVDERADVYAIGVMLDELLSGHDGAKKGQLADLAAIVDKARAPDARDRYANATELADELRRFQTGQLVGARQYTRAELLRRWAKRHRSLLALGAALGAILAVVAVVSVVRIVRERDAANRARAAMEAARKETAERNEVLVLLQARAELDRDPTASLAWLETYPPTSPDWHAVSDVASDAWSRGVARYVWRSEQPFTARALAFSPDGRLVVAGTKERALHAWDLATGAPRPFASDVDLGGPVVFTPDGKVLVSSNGAKAVRMWDVASGERRAIDGMNGTRLRFTSDGKLLLGAGFIEGADVYDMATGKVRAITVDGRGPNAITILEGTHTAALVAGDVLYLEDLDRGERTRLAPVAAERYRGSIEASPDGHWIAVGAPGAVLLFDARTGATRSLPHEGFKTTNVRFSPAGTLATFGNDDGMLRWDLESGKAEDLDVADSVRAVAWSPNGEALVGGENGVLRLYGTLDERSRALLGHRASIAAVAFSNDGKWAASAGADKTVRVWPIGEGDRHVFHGAGGPALLSRDGRLLLASRPRGRSAIVIDVASGAADALTAPRSRVWPSSGTISPDARTVLVSDSGETVTLIDLATKEHRVLTRYGPPGALDMAEDFSPDGQFVAIGTNDGVVQLVTVASGERRVLGKHDGVVTALLFSVDGRAVISAGRDRVVKIWDVAGAGPPRVLKGHSAEVYDVRTSRDGKKLVTASADGTVRVWSLDTGESRELRGHSGIAYAAAFSPDGSRVLSGGSDRTVRLWDVATGDSRILRRSVAAVWGVMYTGDGKSILYSGEEGAIHIVDPSVTPGLDQDAGRLRAWLAAETTARVDPNGVVSSR